MDDAAPTSSHSTHRTGDTVRTGIRGVGQTLVTIGLVVLLFVVYQLYVTNITANAHQRDVERAYAQAVTSHHDPLNGQDRAELPAGRQVILPAGKGFANLYIPRLGKDFAKTIVEGTTDSDLDKGPGHYASTVIPGQIGDFAIAGHRVGKGEPFLNLDQLVPGDAVVVQTASRWYVYRVLGDVKTGNLGVRDSEGVPGREIVSPAATSAIAPVPDHVGLRPTRALMTMTTCHPKYTAEKRMIVHAVLARGLKVVPGARPKELGGSQ